MTSQEQFEAWARGESPSINLTREGSGYRYSLAEMLYGAWQAARAAAPALKPDAITVNLVRYAGLDKHVARSCESIIHCMLLGAARGREEAPNQAETRMDAGVDRGGEVLPAGWVAVPQKPTDAMLCALMQWDSESGFSILQEYTAMLAAAPQPPAAPALPQAGWIPVSEQLPEHLQDVNFVVDDPKTGYLHGRVLGGRYHADTDTFSTPGLGVVASHWQPAPQPPKEQE